MSTPKAARTSHTRCPGAGHRWCSGVVTAQSCAVAGSLVLWLAPRDAFAQDFAGLLLTLGHISVPAAAVFYGGLTWLVARGRAWQIGLTATHLLIAISPYALSEARLFSVGNDLSALIFLNLCACLPLASALAATRRWVELSSLLLLGSWMLPPVLALAAPFVPWGLRLLGWLLRPIGLLPV